MDISATLNEEDEVIQVREPNITFIIDQTTFGKGSLYVAESKLFWKNESTNQVVSVEYESMCVFGTCNHPTVHEKPCMLIIVDFTYKPSDNLHGENGLRQNGVNHEDNIADEDDDDEGVENDDDEDEMKSKIKLVPDNPECLTEIYRVFTLNQSRHSNNDMSSEDEGNEISEHENDEFEDNDEDEEDQMMQMN